MDRDSRLAALRSRLKAEGLDGLLIQRPANIFYLSGFRGESGTLLVTAESAWLFTDARYLEQAAQEAPGWEIGHYGPEGPAERLLEVLRRESGRKHGTVEDRAGEAGAAARSGPLPRAWLGFEADYLTYDRYCHYAESLEHDGARDLQPGLKPVRGLLNDLRQVKDSSELALIRQAARITGKALAMALPALAPGNSELQVAAELEYAMRRLGAEGVAFSTIVASGPRSSLPHGLAGGRVLQEGDMVVVDCGAVYGGYCADLTRTFFLGKSPEPRQQEVYELVRRAQEEGLRAVLPGRRGREVDAVARSVIEAAGYGQNFSHSLGHGVGLLVHEEPALARVSEVALEPGMVVTVEPGVYLGGHFGVRIEDTVAVTEAGAEILTDFGKEFRALNTC